MTELLTPAPELARLLGFKYAELSSRPRWRTSRSRWWTSSTDLAAKSLPQGKAELRDPRLYARAARSGRTGGLDLAYYAEKLKQHKFSVSDEQLRPYFPLVRVVKGLFEVVKRVFGMKVRERLGIDTWHPDVRFYDIFDADDELRGSFTWISMPASTSRAAPGWMSAWVAATVRTAPPAKPVAYLDLQLQRPGGRQNRPCLPTTKWSPVPRVRPRHSPC